MADRAIERLDRIGKALEGGLLTDSQYLCQLWGFSKRRQRYYRQKNPLFSAGSTKKHSKKHPK